MNQRCCSTSPDDGRGSTLGGPGTSKSEIARFTSNDFSSLARTRSRAAPARCQVCTQRLAFAICSGVQPEKLSVGFTPGNIVRRLEPSTDADRKLSAVREAARHSYPAPTDVDEVFPVDRDAVERAGRAS